MEIHTETYGGSDVMLDARACVYVYVYEGVKSERMHRQSQEGEYGTTGSNDCGYERG